MARIPKQVRSYLAKIGSAGGKAARHAGVTSPAKQAAAKRNGKRGGRPVGTRGPNACTKYPSHRFNPNTQKCYGCGFRRPRQQ